MAMPALISSPETSFACDNYCRGYLEKVIILLMDTMTNFHFTKTKMKIIALWNVAERPSIPTAF